jgi:hypothetical protein
MRRQLSKKDAAERWLKLSLYVLRKRAKARTNGARILYPAINDATGFCDPLRSGMTAQATAQAHWSRAYRQRRKAGKIVVELEVDEARIAAALIEARLLSPLPMTAPSLSDAPVRFEGGEDRRSAQSMSLLGVKRTWVAALHMSALTQSGH